jgi:hypothetical protein
MKKMVIPIAVAGILLTSLQSCKKTSNDIADENGLSQQERGLVAAAGFNSNWAEKTTDGKFLIEGDILLSREDLVEMGNEAPSHELIIANEEHYRTTKIVSTPTTGARIITVSLGAGFPSHYSDGLDAALARYNSYGLKIQFQRVSSGADIPITGQNLGTSGGGCILGQAGGFPKGGNPGRGFVLSTSSCATSYLSTATRADEVIAHEIGHCIGFRHTDYMNRSSCGQNVNEGSAGVGAVWIPNTPTTVSGNYNSWMMACTNGSAGFGNEDVVALNYVY